MKGIAQNKLYKVLSLNAVSVGVSLVLGVISTKIISIFLGTQGMALMGSLRNFVAMLKSAATLGISNSAVRLLVEYKEDKEELSGIYATFFWIFLSVSAVLGLFVFATAGPVSAFLFQTDAYVLPLRVFALALPLVVLNTFWLAVYNALELFRKIIIIQILSNIIIFGITVLLVWEGNLAGGLLSVAIAEAAIVAVTYFFIRQHPEYFRFDWRKAINRKHTAVIGSFSAMALLSAVLTPLTLILVRNHIIDTQSLEQAGVWDGVLRLSGFYMIFFHSGLSLYYMPKLSGINDDTGFRHELKLYFKTLVPLFAMMLLLLYFLRGWVVGLAFTDAFSGMNDVLAWQLAGDFLRIMTLAFGFQVLVKTMMREYFFIEIAFNATFLVLSYLLLPTEGIAGALQAYCWANAFGLLIVLFIFRKLLFARS
ncbi:O-antigen translocase [Flavobacterium longum]|uniref:O-antigen translocase n=1 Tax=Flavobacterium longum TaxID=1299340 RepID=UPI0039E82229